MHIGESVTATACLSLHFAFISSLSLAALFGCLLHNVIVVFLLAFINGAAKLPCNVTGLDKFSIKVKQWVHGYRL